MEIAPARKINQFGDVYIGGQAKVQLGDAYTANRDLFEDGTKEECREGKDRHKVCGSNTLALTLTSAKDCPGFRRYAQEGTADLAI